MRILQPSRFPSSYSDYPYSNWPSISRHRTRGGPALHDVSSRPTTSRMGLTSRIQHPRLGGSMQLLAFSVCRPCAPCPSSRSSSVPRHCVSRIGGDSRLFALDFTYASSDRTLVALARVIEPSLSLEDLKSKRPARHSAVCMGVARGFGLAVSRIRVTCVASCATCWYGPPIPVHPFIPATC